MILQAFQIQHKNLNKGQGKYGFGKIKGYLF